MFNNLTIRQFCKNCKISLQTYNNLLNKQEEIKINDLIKISNLIEISLCELFFSNSHLAKIPPFYKL